MRYKKTYGLSRVNICPFCTSMATIKNKQGVPVCQKHLKNSIEERKCSCGNWLELLSGKWGPYFRCQNCGNMNFKKAMNMEQNTDSNRNLPYKTIARK